MAPCSSREVITATRGSFASEQALHGTEVLARKYGDFCFKEGYTYLFEVIYKNNRIVVDYGDMDDLVLLTIIKTETGRDLSLIRNPEFLKEIPFPVVKHYDGVADVAALSRIQEANKEGFVVRFSSGLRVKIKMEEYKRLHRLLTQCNARTIWEILKSGQSLEQFLDRVPDEFYNWVKKTNAELLAQFAAIEQECAQIVVQVQDLPSRKEQALVVVKTRYSGIVFSMLDHKNYQEAIWKLLYPAATKPFAVDEEG